MYLYCIVIIVCKVLRFVAYIVMYAYNLSRLLNVPNEFTNGLIIPDEILYDTVIQVNPNPYDPDHRKVLITKLFVIKPLFFPHQSFLEDDYYVSNFHDNSTKFVMWIEMVKVTIRMASWL